MVPTRRDALKQIAAAGIGCAVSPGVVWGQDASIAIAGRPAQIAIASVSPSTVRITISPLVSGVAQNLRPSGALVEAAAGRGVGSWRAPFPVARAGDLTVRFSPGPSPFACGARSIRRVIETRQGQPVQLLTLDPQQPTIAFSLGKGHVFGLGEGGPQFDRKGQTFGTRNGQGGYQLRTHGGRVPIQWLMSTDGWGMYIHQPLGAFDLTGAQGKLTPVNDALPIDVFIVASRDPKVLMREYARVTGFAELPPLWSFGYMQSHRTLAGPGRDRMGGADVPREAAAV